MLTQENQPEWGLRLVFLCLLIELQVEGEKTLYLNSKI